MRWFLYRTVHVHLRSGTVLKVKCSHWEMTAKDNVTTKYRFNGIFNWIKIRNPQDIIAYEVRNPWWFQLYWAIYIRLKNDNKLD